MGRSRVLRENLTYFYDFIETLEANYPYASYAAVIEEIAFARVAGPIEAGLLRNDEGFYQMIVPIGYGNKAIIELERDKQGKLQPVMGGILEE